MVESMSEAESMDEQTVESTVAPSSEPVLKKGKRPLSPHLQIYKPQITSVLSIIHRFTGLISVVAITCIVVWLFLVSVGGHDTVVLGQKFSYILNVAVILFIFAFLYHFLNGIRYLVWSTGRGIKNRTAQVTGYIVVLLTVVISLGLVYCVWIS
jgi:succinate dehydrogenase / fumarate reductase cytochrome b subunit